MHSSSAAMTAAIGLLPFLFRADDSGPWQPPLVVFVQTLLRWLAIVNGAALLFFVAGVSLGDFGWSRVNVNFALGLGGAILTATALQFLVAAWARLVAASNSHRIRDGRPVKLATSTIGLATGACFAVMVALAMMVALGERPDGSRADLLSDTALAMIVLAGLCCAGCSMWLYAMLNADRDARFERLASRLAEADGGWRLIEARPANADSDYTAWSAYAWVVAEQWFWIPDDFETLISYRDDASRDRSVPISVELNARHLTLWGGQVPARCVGARVREATWLPSFAARLAAHYGAPADLDEVAATLPAKVRRTLVRFDHPDFRAVGLSASVRRGPTRPPRTDAKQQFPGPAPAARTTPARRTTAARMPVG